MANNSPADIAAAALGIPIADIGAVEPIKHGLTNESWLVRAGDEAVVVRVSAGNDDELRIDRGSEALILAHVAREGVGAPVIACEPQRHVLVTRYLGPPWSYDAARETANIMRLGLLLKMLHQASAPSGVRAVDLAATAAGYRRTLELHGAGGALLSQAYNDQARAAAASLKQFGHACLCHNDVHHLNIVDCGDLRLIDWEYAGIGEPFFDLASACVYHRYDRARRAALLSSYAGNGRAGIETQLEHALWLFEYIRDLWTAVRALPQR